MGFFDSDTCCELPARQCLSRHREVDATTRTTQRVGGVRGRGRSNIADLCRKQYGRDKSAELRPAIDSFHNVALATNSVFSVDITRTCMHVMSSENLSSEADQV